MPCRHARRAQIPLQIASSKMTQADRKVARISGETP
jgi:hypothetical protein